MIATRRALERVDDQVAAVEQRPDKAVPYIDCGAPTTLGPCTRSKGHLSESHWHIGDCEALDKAVTAFWAVSRAARTNTNVTSETDALARVVHEAIAYGRRLAAHCPETALPGDAGRAAARANELSFAEGRQAERAAISKWLRAWAAEREPSETFYGNANGIADAIERGEHFLETKP